MSGGGYTAQLLRTVAQLDVLAQARVQATYHLPVLCVCVCVCTCVVVCVRDRDGETGGVGERGGGGEEIEEERASMKLITHVVFNRGYFN